MTSLPPVRKVQAADRNRERTNICAVWLFDENGTQVAQYNPWDWDVYQGELVELRENEEIIGVYGVKDKVDWFSNFGFIAKVN